MKKFGQRILAFGLAGIMALGVAGCGQNNNNTASATTEEITSAEVSSEENEVQENTLHKIAVIVYNTDDDEVRMFRSYYEDYLENTFDVDFVYSDSISDINQEKEFIDNAKAEGCEGVISFVSYNLPEIVDYCEDLYYVAGSTSYSDDIFEQVKGKENFLGTMSPTSEDEIQAGASMIEALGAENGSSKNWVVCSGGSPLGNFAHKQRLIGMLDTLENKLGFTLTAKPEEIAAAKESMVIAENPAGGKVTLAPGYFSREAFHDSVVATIDDNTDIVASVCNIHPILTNIEETETSANKNIKIGAVDCFSDQNADAINNPDASGNPQIDYIVGKCQAMGAPAFIALYNAITGHADLVRNNNEAFRLYQGFWTASNPDEYNELKVKADNIYTNVYGSKDMMDVMAIYNPAATFADFENFVNKINE
ncbi:MAG: hypothetical protein Q4E53_07330 [Eubacteriales bacterium]|nr:hypothetical protein [Eubacteriales bacterium]